MAKFANVLNLLKHGKMSARSLATFGAVSRAAKKFSNQKPLPNKTKHNLSNNNRAKVKYMYNENATMTWTNPNKIKFNKNKKELALRLLEKYRAVPNFLLFNLPINKQKNVKTFSMLNGKRPRTTNNNRSPKKPRHN